MTIETVEEPGKLLLEIAGRLDTATAPKLEETLKNKLEGVVELVLDITGLEYISSAGLRVLLTAHKTMKRQEGSMIVRGANEDIREVFVITGFINILTVE